MKKFLAIILSIATVLCLFAACGKETTEEPSEPEVTTAKHGAFSYIILEDGTAAITAYSSEEAVDELEIPDTMGNVDVTVIAKDAFAGVDNITKVKFPKTITTIEAGAFKGSSIKNALMTSSRKLTTIGEEAFADCEKLVQVDIPASVETIGDNAFANATALMVFTLRGDTPLTKAMFEGAKANLTIWAYEDAPNAKAFAKDAGYGFKTLKKGSN